jgi:RimJ/RimL family protein N-acetyltransferase
VQAWLSDPDAMRFNEVRYPVALPRLRDRATAPLPYGWALAHFAVEALDCGQRVGEASLVGRGGPEDGRAEMVILIGPEFRGLGYGSDTVSTLCRFGFEMMNLHRIELEVNAGNARGRHVYERAGFVMDGTRRHAQFHASRWEDIVIMSFLRSEWEAAHGRPEE